MLTIKVSRSCLLSPQLTLYLELPTYGLSTNNHRSPQEARKKPYLSIKCELAS